MKIRVVLLICLHLCFMCSSKEITSTPESTNSTRKHRSIVTVLGIPQYKLFKRPSIHRSRILHGAPVKIINHHFYCDHSKYPAQGLSFLSIPKDVNHYDVKLQPHVEVASINYDTNKHLDNFEVNLPPITKGSYTSENDIVPPVLTGTLPGIDFKKQQYNVYLNHELGHYLSENNENKVASTDGHFGSGTGNGYETNKHGEFLKLPSIRDHPLEHEPNRATYGSPGAVNSYGDPIQPSTDSSHGSGYNGDILNSFGNDPYGSFADNSGNMHNQVDFNSHWPDRDIISLINNINVDRVERQAPKKNKKVSRKKNSEVKIRTDATTVRYPNHRYER